MCNKAVAFQPEYSLNPVRLHKRQDCAAMLDGLLAEERSFRLLHESSFRSGWLRRKRTSQTFLAWDADMSEDFNHDQDAAGPLGPRLFDIVRK